MRFALEVFLIIAVMASISIGVIALNQRDHCRAEVERQEIVLDQWETYYQFQGEIHKVWDERVRVDRKVIVKLNDDIRGYKALNEALEGRIRKMAGGYHIREMNLLAEIERLKEELQIRMTPPNKIPNWDALEPTCQ